MINTVRWCDSPRTIDIIQFELETTNESGEIVDPYIFENISVYYLQRGMQNRNVYEEKHYSPKLEKELEFALEEGNQEKVKFFKKQMETTSVGQPIFYSDLVLVMKTHSPLWIADKESNDLGRMLDKKKKPIPGRFAFLWHPVETDKGDIKMLKSGNYVIKWNWKAKKNSKLFSAYKSFFINPTTIQRPSIHLKRSPRDKYEFLMDRYLPRMYKNKIAENDLTYDVVNKINKSAAEGFTIIEDLAADLFEILDANFTHPDALPLLGNLFNLDLKYNDITLWRRQVKEAIPLFKKKGTLGGLKEALEQSGILLVKLKNLWQITSKYTWTDSFTITSDAFDDNSDYTQSIVGNLSKIPIDTEDVEIWLREHDSEEYIKIPSEVATIYLPKEANEKPTLVWNSNKLEHPINLIKGDIVKIKYKYQEIPESEKSIEDYIQSLPLADQRDETKQQYPRKNWNVRLIEEDDPLFDVAIKERHPFYDPVIFGKIRTVFLYSENVYNMDTYNGSLRDSNAPCDIDKDFIDECSYGQSSKFNVDLEIEGLSDDRIEEAREIIREYSPFHAILHQMRVVGKVNDFVMPPNEFVNYLVKDKRDGAPKDAVNVEESIMYQIRHKDGTAEMYKVER